jgi:small subunit ribosomal protein S1
MPDHPVPEPSNDASASPSPASSLASPQQPSAARKGDLDHRLAEEIEAALGDMSISELLDADDRKPATRPGRAAASAGAAPARTDRERRTGTIIQIHGNDVFVEFSARSQGVCPLAMFPEPPALGAKMEFIIERFDKDDGLLVLSREGTVRKAEWESLEPGQIVEARCVGVNKGGLDMEIANHRAFMPAGQVDIRFHQDLSVFVGEKMPCEVKEVDRQRGRIILSRRAALEVERSHLRMKLLGSLEVGQTMPATITSIQAYGAFADIGGVDGLIHISDLAWERVKHPSDVVKEGQQVMVKVLKIDSAQDPPKIGLGMKQTLENPAIAARASLKEGDTVQGRVTKIMPFGAFVELSPGVEGLVHISELSHDRIHDVRQAVKPDEIVPVKILSIDPAGKKISLSIKQTKERQEQVAQRKEDRKMEQLRGQLNKKWGAIPLKGGLG